MFFTRYNKGRPRGFPTDKEVYVCEARYNEEKYKLNKIKTWASCVPDEVREKDYEMDLFDTPRKMKKVPSPIKHLLREDAKEDDPLPKPTWGVINAPPIVGAVHKRPREANESPPPEPTPSPPPPQLPSPDPPRRSTTSDRPRFDSQGDTSMSGTTSNPPLASPAPNTASAQSPYGQQFAPVRPSPSPAPAVLQTSYNSHSSTHSSVQPSPVYQSQNSYGQYNSISTPVAQHHNPLPNHQYQGSHTAPRPAAPSTVSHGGHANAYNPPRAVEVYTLADVANASIPADIREQFHRDEYGRVIFFTAPPLDSYRVTEDFKGLGHSLQYLADKARAKNEDEKKRKARMIDFEAETNARIKRMKVDEANSLQQALGQRLDSMRAWSEEVDQTTDDLYKSLHGDDWRDMRRLDVAKLAIQQEDAAKKQRQKETFEKGVKDTDVRIPGFKWV